MRLFQVDAFADSVFAGNPAAVCLLAGPAEARWMQPVAAEMNLSETAFVGPEARRVTGCAGSPRRSRWACAGTPPWPPPTSCMRPGWRSTAEPVRFDSVSGPLTARHEDGLLVLDFPARPAGPAPAPPGLLAALGVDSAEWTGQAKDDLMVVLRREEEVTGLRPDTRGAGRIRHRAASS